MAALRWETMGVWGLRLVSWKQMKQQVPREPL